MFSSVYVTAMAMSGLVSQESRGSDFQAGLAQLELTRLFVVVKIAYAMIAILGAVLVITILVCR